MCTSHIGSRQLFGLSGPRCRNVGSKWIFSWRATSLHFPELNKRQRKHCYILTPYQIVSTAKLLCQLPVQKQLSSWWLQPEQLFSRFRTCWRRNQMKGPVDFARLKSPSSLRAENAPLVHRRLMNLSLIARNRMFRCLGGRVVLLKESLLVRATLLRRPPYEAAYGVMMSRDESEWVRSNSVVWFTVGDLWWPVLRVPISCRSHRRWMTSVVTDRPLYARF